MSAITSKMLIDDNEFPSLPKKVMKQTLLAPITKVRQEDPFNGLNTTQKKEKECFLKYLNEESFHRELVKFAEEYLCIRVKDASDLKYWAQYCKERSDKSCTTKTLFHCILEHDDLTYGIAYEHRFYHGGFEVNKFIIKEHNDGCCGYSCGFFQCPTGEPKKLHYCNDPHCEWDCGTLWCGCIDVCRGRCGFKGNEW